jgi:ferric iron reductase protein FhuF
VREPYTLLDGLISETAARWNAPHHVGAALWWKTYGYWHSLPMAMAWAFGEKVPVMKLSDTYFKVSEAGVTLGATSVTWESGVEAIRASLAESQQPLVKTISTIAKVGERTLWGSTAEAFAHPLTTVAKGDYMALLREIGKPVDGLVEPVDERYFRRTCCLWVTLPDADACGTCCVLRPRPQR